MDFRMEFKVYQGTFPCFNGVEYYMMTNVKNRLGISSVTRYRRILPSANLTRKVGGRLLPISPPRSAILTKRMARNLLYLTVSPSLRAAVAPSWTEGIRQSSYAVPGRDLYSKEAQRSASNLCRKTRRLSRRPFSKSTLSSCSNRWYIKPAELQQIIPSIQLCYLNVFCDVE